MGLLESLLSSTQSYVDRKRADVEKYSVYAERMSDERLLREIQDTSDYAKKYAYAQEYKSRHNQE